MNRLLRSFVTSIKAKLLPITRRIRLWFSPAFLRNQVFIKVRQFFRNLLDIRPRNGKDYYGIFGWLVSKRLAFALVVGLALVSGIYIYSTLPEDMTSQETGVKTFRYRSFPLRFYEGEVNILDSNGQLGYSGYVKAGAAEGEGILYDGSGQPVYEGQFSASRYNGRGTLYYSSGTPRYTGDFVNNLFDGVGRYNRPNGVTEYQGDYVSGVRSGTGSLFNSVGDIVFTGSFLNDQVVYSDLLGRPTTEMAKVYTGRELVYQNDQEYCVGMPDIQALCNVRDGENSLENEWMVTDVLVLSSRLTVEGKTCTTMEEIGQALGTPHYYGSASVSLAEAAAINMLEGDAAQELLPVDMETQSLFDDVFQVTDYDSSYQVYLYTYEKDGLLYTFYTPGAGLPGFLMYAIARA